MAALIALAALVPAMSLGVVSDDPAAAGTGASSASVDVRLNGPWRFRLGDDPAWADPGFDDSAWEIRTVPTEGGQADFDAQNSLAWFRREFTVPAGAAGTDLYLSLGVIDDADEVFVNGTLVAGSGVLPPDPPATAFFWNRLYDIPEAPLRFGETNTIAVRVNDTGGGGGFTSGPVALLSRDQVAADVFGQPYTAGGAALALETLTTQADAIAAGDVDAYAATLDPDYFHAGHDVARSRSRLEELLAEHTGLRRSDEVVGAGEAPDGALVVEVRRTWTATSPDGAEVVPEWRGVARAPLDGPDATLAYLRFDAVTGLELGDRARLFRDAVVSVAAGGRREFDVYLPPSYFDGTDRRYPTVYLLHGAGGNNKEWEGKGIDRRLDALIAAGAIDELIVVMPDGKSIEGKNSWYVDSADDPWRTMFFDELLPQVDATFRTIDDRGHRGISGWSMGGQGAFTNGWAAPDVFGSIASLSGALSFPPLAGAPADLATNAPEAPVVLVNTKDPFFLRSYCYYLYSGEDDDFAFDEAARAMQVELATRTVLVTAEIKPSPAYHADHVQLPGLAPSFRLHSNAFGTHDELLGCEYRVPANQAPRPADDSIELSTPTAILDVLANDMDPDFDPLRFGAIGEPRHGTVVDNGDGTLRYRSTGELLDDEFTYEVLDGRGAVASATVRLAGADGPGGAGGVEDGAGAPATGRLPATGTPMPVAAALLVISVGLVLRLRRGADRDPAS